MTRYGKGCLTKPLMTAFLAPLIDRGDIKNRCELSIPKKQCIVGLATVAKRATSEVGYL